jgi:hypothetical protein
MKLFHLITIALFLLPSSSYARDYERGDISYICLIKGVEENAK